MSRWLNLTIWMVLSMIHIAAAEVSADPLQALRRSNEGVHRFILDNGMVGLIKRDASAPVVAVQIWVGTGSVHTLTPCLFGFSRLPAFFERFMLIDAKEHLSKLEVWIHVERVRACLSFFARI